jgi:type IV pilus assembly protein PilA
MDGDRRNDGFTLIELMVVVLIIAILLAVAIPTFLGAQQNARRRAAQANVRNVFTVEMVHYSDYGRFTEDEALLQAQDSVFTYDNMLPIPSSPRSAFIDVQTSPGGRPDDTVYIASRTVDGECFWLRTVGNEGVPRFAEDDCSGTALVFKDSW